MKKWGTLPLCFAFMALVSGAEFPYQCSGDFDCPDCADGTDRTRITCQVLGEHSSPVWCHTDVQGDILICQARVGDNIVDEDEVRCERCRGGLGGGGGGCDPIGPFWWIFCDPFAL